MYKTFMISLLSLLLFTGCNFNEEAEDAPVTISDVDLAYSAIGITYVCSSGIVAYTDSSGVFSCNKSDNVTVYLGSNEIITISDKGDLITPYDLFEGDSEAALNYVRLLEVLDTNNGANGALELDEEALEKLPNDLDFSSVTFEQEVESILQTQLITRTEAQEKLNTEVVNAGGTIPNGSNQPVGVITESVSGTLVSVNASLSSDADNDSLTYQWDLKSPDGSTAVLSSTTAEVVTFVTDKSGIYTVSLIVNDSNIDSVLVTKNIDIAPTQIFPPVSDAGVTQSVLTNLPVTLDGTLSNPNGAAITYNWDIVFQPANSSIVLSDESLPKPTFTPLKGGQYIFDLNVSNVNGSSVDRVIINVTSTNLAPVANAGTNQNVDTTSLVTLDGSSSSDANSDTLTYAWTLVSEPGGSSITLSNATTVSPTFTANVDGIYEFSLVVNDGQVDSADVNVTITASTPEVPVANAGVDQNVFTNAVVTLDGTLSDDKGEIISYSWSITAQPISSSITLSNTAVSQPTFTPVVDGNYTFDLNVSNVNGSSIDSIVVSVINPNAAPVANAGTNQNVATPSSVTLNGSASSDANGDTLTFAWTLVSEPDGSSITLSNATTVSPTFTANVDGVYIFSLVVNDGQVDSAGITVSVTASTLNIAPIANAGIDQNVPVGATVSLDGNSSSDANDGDVLTYAWTLVRPALSNAILTSETSAFPSFTADEAGIYSIQLIVKDDENLSSAIDTVVVTVSITNSAPTANAGVDGTVYQNAAYTLDGSGSFDSDGDTITYAWSIFTGGSGSFSDDTVVNPTFTPAQSGAYVLQLVVNDGDLLSNVDKMTLTVLAVEDLKKSGQTIVYTTNDDGTYQKGAASNYTVSSSGTSTVKDEVTSLSWSNVSAGNKLYAEAEAYCSSLDVDGISDWRIPTENELFTIVNFANSSPSIDSVFSINYPYRYWTSTLNNGFNVVINFMDATTEIAGGYNDIRCVSGNRVTQNYTRDDTNNIVNDNIHNIMWADINNSVLLNNGEFTFVDAISYCEDLTHGSFSDWRLPNIVELISATDFENKTSVFNVHFDENMNEAWSSTASTYFSGGYVYTVKNAGSTFSPDEAIVDNNLKDTSFSGSNESKLKCVRDSL